MPDSRDKQRLSIPYASSKRNQEAGDQLCGQMEARGLSLTPQHIVLNKSSHTPSPTISLHTVGFGNHSRRWQSLASRLAEVVWTPSEQVSPHLGHMAVLTSPLCHPAPQSQEVLTKRGVLGTEPQSGLSALYTLPHLTLITLWPGCFYPFSRFWEA